MVLVDMNVTEVKALDELMKDAKCPVQMGMILGLFRGKIEVAFKKEVEKLTKQKAKEILGDKKKKP